MQALRKHIVGLQPAINLQLVVVSPLMRTLETACGVFGAVRLACSAAVLSAACVTRHLRSCAPMQHCRAAHPCTAEHPSETS